MLDVELISGPKLVRRSMLINMCLATFSVLSGCQTSQKLEVTQTGAPKFDRFRAEYRFEQADKLLSRSFKPSPDENVSGELQTVSAATSWSNARLHIECPHPTGDPSLALVKLTLSDRKGPKTLIRKDARELTIERSDIELLISDLANQGFFDETTGDSGTTQLEVQIDHGRINRRWFNDARLLDLARQTLAEGSPATR